MEYKTIADYAFDEFIEKKSRFIGYIKPVTTEEEAISFINQKREAHRDATHNVYAYILRDGQIKRYSDDGEPSGTAGIPVLDVLQKEGLTDTAVVVTRYFGGIMLGAGGLVRAYSHGAKIAVDAAEILYMAPCTKLQIELDYSLYGKITYALPKYYVVIDASDFGVLVKLDLTIKDKFLDAFKKELCEITSDSVTLREIGKLYANIKEE